jgi:spermidine synthase
MLKINNLFKKLLLQKFAFFAFITGFSMMVVELTASRILAPIVGSSVYTWTSIIGIMLLGLVFGNFLGGYLIDKKQKIETVSLFYYLSSISIILIPAFSQKISQVILLNISLFALTLLSAFLLFFIPSVLIGAIYPCLFKFEIISFSSLGLNSGKMSGAWSAGSILGTFLTGFFFIENIGSSQTLYLISFLLLLSGFLLNKKKIKPFLIFLLISITFLYFLNNIQQTRQGSSSIIYNKESPYYRIRVAEKNNLRYLFLDLDSHSIEEINKKNNDIDLYTNIPPVFSAFKKTITSVLVIGGGSQAISENFSLNYPESKIKTVELDGEVANVAKKYFPRSAGKIETEISDGRFFLKKDTNKYDIIFSDAYNSFISVPYHLTTLEFNAIAKEKLNPGGIYAVNFISSLEGDNSLFFQSMLKTFSKTFSQYYAFSYGKNNQEVQNIILLGINSTNVINNDDITASLTKIDPSGYYSKKIIKEPYSFVKKNQAFLLKDDFAPTEKLMNPIIKNYFPKYAAFYLNTI